uniref:Titin n=1 Tax=Sparus aurata TaxID=8175 RepID=A0A671YD56_SPAAU
LSTFTVKNGQDLKVEIPVVGHPKPKVEWKRDGQAVRETSRLEISNTSSLTVLHIRHGAREHSGQYSITASNCAGKYTGDITVVVLEKPDPPTGPVRIDEISSDYVTISWDPPEYTGGCQLDNYIVEKRETTSTDWQTVSATTVRTTIKATKLKTGNEYQFRTFIVSVRACSMLRLFVTIRGRPEPVVKWSKEGGTISERVQIEVTTLEVTINGLVKGKEYLFRVSAVNEKGKSEPKYLLAPVTVNDTSAGPIINLLCNTFNVKAGNDLKIEVPFKALPLPTIAWNKDGSLLKETSRVNTHVSDTSSQITIKDATRIDAGMYEVTLTNSAGTTSAEIFVNVVERPGPPSDLSVDEVSADFVSLSWQPPHYTGGCEISNYVVEKRDTSSTMWQTVSATVARTSIKISRLTQGTEYQFRIAAENRYGKSHFVESEPVVAQYPFKPPGQPTDLRILNASKSVMVVVWSKPDSDGGSPVIGYHIECKDQSSILWTKLNKSPVTENQFKVTSVEEGLIYEFRVCAENMAGIGPCSKASEPVAARDQCDPPRNLTVTNITNSSVSLSWDKPEYDGGAKITGYIVEQKREKQGVRWVRVNKKPVYDLRVKASCLQEGCEYEFRVFAENAAGLSEPSLPCQLTLAEDPKFLPSPPAKPTIIDSSKSSITLLGDKSRSLACLLPRGEVIISLSSCQDHHLVLISIKCCSEKSVSKFSVNNILPEAAVL